MHISRKSDYALRALLYISNQEPDKRSSISEIAENECIPRDFLAKILKGLTKSGMLKSFQGVRGGYQLAKPKETITFLDVIEAMEGELKVSLCVAAKEDCGCGKLDNCAMKEFWEKVQQDLIKTLSDANFGDPSLRY